MVVSEPTLCRVMESLTHWGRACTHHTELACDAPDGADHNFWYVRSGLNLEMSELNAAFGRFSLARFAEHEAARGARYQILHDALVTRERVRVYSRREADGTPFVFPITVSDGDARPLSDRLLTRGVEVRSLMGGAMSRQPAFQSMSNDGLARCESMARASFFVGIHQTLPLEDVRELARIVAEEVS